MKFPYISLLLLCSFLISCNTQKDELNWLNGHWEGVGYQPNLKENISWGITLNLDLQDKTFLADYPSLKCAGKWKLMDSSPYRVVFEETILNNVENCTDQGTIVITKIDKDHISYSYFQLAIDTVSSYATLKRKRP